MSVGDVLLLVMALVFPPLPVAIKRGFCSGAFWLNLLLSILAFIPGTIHAWYIILKYPEQVHHHHIVHVNSQAQRDLERNPINGTYPGPVYQAPAITAGPSSGNMDGVYGNQPRIEAGSHAGPAKGQAKGYGTVGDPNQPPAYSPK